MPRSEDFPFGISTKLRTRLMAGEAPVHGDACVRQVRLVGGDDAFKTPCVAETDDMVYLLFESDRAERHLRITVKKHTVWPSMRCDVLVTKAAKEIADQLAKEKAERPKFQLSTTHCSRIGLRSAMKALST